MTGNNLKTYRIMTRSLPAHRQRAHIPAMLQRTSRALRRAARAPFRASSATAQASALSLGLNLRAGASAVEDFILTYGTPVNASLAPGGPSRRLCVVKVGGEVVAKDAATLVASLARLRDASLLPVVVHGGGPQLNDELAKAGVEPNYIGGHRVTDAPTMAVARRVFEAANAQLVAALEAAGLPAAPFLGGVFRAVVADEKLGLVGRITSVDAAGVEAAIAAGRIPVLTSIGVHEGAPGGVLNINADVAARELAIALQPLRVVFISVRAAGPREGTPDGGARARTRQTVLTHMYTHTLLAGRRRVEGGRRHHLRAGHGQ